MKFNESAGFINFGKKITFFALVLTILGGMLKLFSLPGNIFFITGLFTLTLVSFFILANLPYKPIEKNDEANNHLRPLWNFSIKIFGWGLSVLLIAILFSVMHWKGWNFFLTAGIITTVLSAVALFFYRRQRSKYIFE